MGDLQHYKDVSFIALQTGHKQVFSALHEGYWPLEQTSYFGLQRPTCAQGVCTLYAVNRQVLSAFTDNRLDNIPDGVRVVRLRDVVVQAVRA